MNRVLWVAVASALAVMPVLASSAASRAPVPDFQTSDRCVACHNGLLTPSGEDVSIGFDWRASMMANAARDPYWQAGVRRETLDYPESAAAIEDECAICHMPIVRYEAKVRGESAGVFAHIPFVRDTREGKRAADGVSCSVCHQISREGLGAPASFTGGFVVESPKDPTARPEYGPYPVDSGHHRIMVSSTDGYAPTQSDHIRESELCATCHTLVTQAFGPGGRVVGRLPEQVPYQEWLHSDYKGSASCQSCHMTPAGVLAPITRVFGRMREGVSRHTFVAANFFMLRMLNRNRDALEVDALPHELSAAADNTVRFLATRAATLAIEAARIEAGRLRAEVVVGNLGGHKLPTAYPSRRAWLHFSVRDRTGRIVFESGALQPDGSIAGNDNDADATTFEPHRAEIQRTDEVQIYETILGGPDGDVTTGLLTATRFLKDNRLLPRGFDKRSADPDVAVHGGAFDDPDFAGGSDRIRYAVPIAGASGPFTLDVELLYQPIGYRWAHNLKPYEKAAEPRRFTGYFEAMAASSATVVVHARSLVDPQGP